MKIFANKFIAVLAVVCLLVCALLCATSCENIIGKLPPNSGNGNRPNVPPYTGEADKIADFANGFSNLFYCSNGYCNGGVFDTYWSNKNATINQDEKTLNLSIKEHSRYAASGAEYRSVKKYGYGYYSVKMQPIGKSGVISSFFTYTGPAEGTAWDEIDIEFLGKDTTKVQFNYFANGKGGHEYLYNLGFEASEEMHEYGFLWEQNSIVWYVDGVAVHRATKDIPTTPARIMVNVWVGRMEGIGNVSGWMGQFDGVFPVDDAKYQWIGYKAI